MIYPRRGKLSNRQVNIGRRAWRKWNKLNLERIHKELGI